MSIKARVMELDAHEETCRKGSFQKQTISASKKTKKTREKKVSKKNINNIGYQEMKYQMMKRASCIVENYNDVVFLKTDIWKNENQKNQCDATYVDYVDKDGDYNVTYVGNVDVNEEDNYDITYIGFVCNIDKISQ